jgi:hypothetical protein
MKDDQILDSWKEISDYLGRSRKTCLLWGKNSVYLYTDMKILPKLEMLFIGLDITSQSM